MRIHIWDALLVVVYAKARAHRSIALSKQDPIYPVHLSPLNKLIPMVHAKVRMDKTPHGNVILLMVNHVQPEPVLLIQKIYSNIHLNVLSTVRLTLVKTIRVQILNHAKAKILTTLIYNAIITLALDAANLLTLLRLD